MAVIGRMASVYIQQSGFDGASDVLNLFFFNLSATTRIMMPRRAVA